MAAATETHEIDMQVDDGLSDSYGRANLNEGELDVQPKTDEEYAQTLLTLRAIVSSKEAGVIIGKAGKNVADLRDETGVKAGVSKVVQGVHDRVLTVTGGLQGCSRAYSIVAKGLLEGAPQVGMGGVVQNNGTHRGFIQMIIFRGIVANFVRISYPSSDFSQSNGNYYRTPRSEDQAHPGCFRCPDGCAERDAAPID